MPSSTIEDLGPENGTDSIRVVEPVGFQTHESTNSILAPAGAAADRGPGLEMLEITPELATGLDTENMKPRSKIRVFAVMGALFVSSRSFTTAPCSVLHVPG
jgi:hypothetical protein